MNIVNSPRKKTLYVTVRISQEREELFDNCLYN